MVANNTLFYVKQAFKSKSKLVINIKIDLNILKYVKVYLIMSNLTESILITDYIANSKKPEDNEWYDRVYLCWEDTDFKKPTTYKPIKGFNCYRYSSFASADYGWNNHRETEQKLEVRHTMIPMCKWVPEMFDRYILKWKLRDMYWLGKNSFGRGYNRYGQTSTSKDK